MMNCPKCMSWRVSGPRYVKRQYGEALEYTCNQCGYSRDEPTADAKEPQHPAQSIAEDWQRQKPN